MKAIELGFGLAWLVLFAAPPFLQAACQDQEPAPPTVYERGLEIIRTQGALAGIEFFEEQAIATEDLRSIFGLAWAYWEDGQFEDAEEIADFVLRLEPDRRLAAACHYLRGFIQITIGEYEKAENHLSQALSLYITEKNLEGQFKSYLGLATVLLKGKDFQGANRILDKAYDVREGQNLAFYYDLETRISFSMGNYGDALAFSELSYREYEALGDGDLMANSMCSIGFFKILTGEVVDGVLKTREVDAIAKQRDLATLSYYNAVNWILAYRSQGFDHALLEKEVRVFAVETGDQFLLDHLSFALAWDCPWQ